MAVRMKYAGCLEDEAHIVGDDFMTVMTGCKGATTMRLDSDFKALSVVEQDTLDDSAKA